MGAFVSQLKFFPGLARTRTRKGACSNPKSSDSSNSPGNAAQLTLMTA